MQDTRTNAEAMTGLFDIDDIVRKGLAKTGVQSGADPVSMPSMDPKPQGLLGLEMPKSWQEEAYEENGGMKYFGKQLLNNLTGGFFEGQIFPDSVGADERYAMQKALYAKRLESQLGVQADEAERERMGALGTNLRDAFSTDDTSDDLEAVMAARAGGMDLADIKHFQQMIGKSFLDPSWETKFDNGVLVRYDKNSDAPAQVVLGDDGNPITEKMDGDMRKTSGWFKRAVPALENMHKLEDRGVTLDREVLTLMQQAQDADGIFQPQVYNQLVNNLGLSKDQKQYLRTAQDLAMIQLRKESGAAIGVQEMFNELSQNVMLSDMSDEGYEYQRGTRGRKYRALSEGMPSYLVDEFKADGYFDTLDALRKGSSRVIQDKPPELLDRNTKPSKGAPEVGLQKDGYIFNGGDPADPANWSKM
jgi:hypothetical protein